MDFGPGITPNPDFGPKSKGYENYQEEHIEVFKYLVNAFLDETRMELVMNPENNQGGGLKQWLISKF